MSDLQNRPTRSPTKESSASSQRPFRKKSSYFPEEAQDDAETSDYNSDDDLEGRKFWLFPQRTNKSEIRERTMKPSTSTTPCHNTMLGEPFDARIKVKSDLEPSRFSPRQIYAPEVTEATPKIVTIEANKSSSPQLQALQELLGLSQALHTTSSNSSPTVDCNKNNNVNLDVTKTKSRAAASEPICMSKSTLSTCHFPCSYDNNNFTMKREDNLLNHSSPSPISKVTSSVVFTEGNCSSGKHNLLRMRQNTSLDELSRRVENLEKQIIAQLREQQENTADFLDTDCEKQDFIISDIFYNSELSVNSILPMQEANHCDKDQTNSPLIRHHSRFNCCEDDNVNRNSLPVKEESIGSRSNAAVDQTVSFFEFHMDQKRQTPRKNESKYFMKYEKRSSTYPPHEALLSDEDTDEDDETLLLIEVSDMAQRFHQF